MINIKRRNTKNLSDTYTKVFSVYMMDLLFKDTDLDYYYFHGNYQSAQYLPKKCTRNILVYSCGKLKFKFVILITEHAYTSYNFIYVMRKGEIEWKEIYDFSVRNNKFPLDQFIENNLKICQEKAVMIIDD